MSEHREALVIYSVQRKLYIGMDRESGDWHFTSRLGDVTFWDREQDARRYMAICHREADRDDWKVCKVKLNLKEL